MKKITLLTLLLSVFSYSQTPITDTNFKTAINTCLSTNPVDGNCTSSEYGAMKDWDVSNVTNMEGAFQGATDFNGDISNWDVSKVTQMNWMFRRASSFNGNISNWDVRNVTSMKDMFYGADSFNGDISNWDVSNVTNMSGIFAFSDSFNGDLSNWNVSNVTSMNSMFNGADSFNGDISNWEVNKVTDMNAMFNNAKSFNGDLNNWDVSKATRMKWMFSRATSFNGDISNWDVSKVTDMTDMFNNSGLSTENYDALLATWSTLSLQPNVTFGAEEINYCSSEEARQTMIDNFGWSITDAGLDCGLSIEDNNTESYLIYPNPTNKFIHIETNGNPVNVSIYNVLGKKVISTKNTNQLDVSKLAEGVYTVKISEDNKTQTHKFIKL